MNAAALAALAFGAVLLSSSSVRAPSMGPQQRAMAAIITAAAKRYGVPLQVALAFAWLESGLRPTAEGDLGWATWNGGERYRKHVLNNPRFAQSPYRTDAARWHSYGLFQLNAAHFAGPTEDPRKLLEPATNADRGCKYIASCLKRAGGDVRKARLLYAGATQLDAAAQAKVVGRLDAALRAFA